MGAATSGRTVTLQAIRRLVVIANDSLSHSVAFVLGSTTITLAAAAGAGPFSPPRADSAGAATFRNDSSLTRVADPVGSQATTEGWICLGRDLALEQRMIAQLQARTAAVPGMWRGGVR